MPSDELSHLHLQSCAQAFFPSAAIDVIYSPGEIIHIDVNGRRYTFEIGSDDDEYVFTDGVTVCSRSDHGFLGFLLTRLPNPS